MITFFISDCVGKCRDFSFLLQGKLVNIEWQHWQHNFCSIITEMQSSDAHTK